jgi:hypothetical protein
MWATQKERGFTVIEVSIFVAISGLLLFVALLGVSNTTNTARFNDGVRSLETFLQGEYANVVNGVNPRDDTSGCPGGGGPSQPGTGDCLLLGRVVEITNNATEVKSYMVTGTIPVTPPPATTADTNYVRFYAPQKTTVSQETFIIPWDVETQIFKRNNGPGSPVNSLAFLRSPQSGQVIAYTFNNILSFGDVNGPLPVILTAGVNDIYSGTAFQQAYICMNSPFITGQKGIVGIGGGQGQDLIKAALGLSNATTQTGIGGISC